VAAWRREGDADASFDNDWQGVAVANGRLLAGLPGALP